MPDELTPLEELLGHPIPQYQKDMMKIAAVDVLEREIYAATARPVSAYMFPHDFHPQIMRYFGIPVIRGEKFGVFYEAQVVT